MSLDVSDDDHRARLHLSRLSLERRPIWSVHLAEVPKPHHFEFNSLPLAWLGTPKELRENYGYQCK